jgi:hypothetical protein
MKLWLGSVNEICLQGLDSWSIIYARICIQSWFDVATAGHECCGLSALEEWIHTFKDNWFAGIMWCTTLHVDTFELTSAPRTASHVLPWQHSWGEFWCQQGWHRRRMDVERSVVRITWAQQDPWRNLWILNSWLIKHVFCVRAPRCARQRAHTATQYVYCKNSSRKS